MTAGEEAAVELEFAANTGSRAPSASLSAGATALRRGAIALREIARLRAENERLAGALLDMVNVGLRCDLNPTLLFRADTRTHDFWRDYIGGADKALRQRARAALYPERLAYGVVAVPQRGGKGR